MFSSDLEIIKNNYKYIVEIQNSLFIETQHLSPYYDKIKNLRRDREILTE